MSDGCARLWAGVVSQAIADMNSNLALERAPAKRWIYSDKTTPGSFLWVCDHIDLDASKLRMMCLTRSGRKQLIRKNGPRRKEDDLNVSTDKVVSVPNESIP